MSTPFDPANDPANEKLDVARGAVADFLSANPNYSRERDDLHAEAYLALVTILRKHPRASEDYLFVSIKRAIVEYVQSLPMFHVPRSTIRRCVNEGRDVPDLPRIVGGPDGLADEDEDTEIDFDLLEDCCRDEVDEQIVDLKAQGYTVEEIGEELGKSKGAVSKRWKKIAKRYRIRETK